VNDNARSDDSLNAEDSEQEFYGYADYTAEELLDQAQSNAQATIMATALFLHQKGISLDEWATALGTTFALAWDDTRSWEAGEFMDAVLTNMRSLGARVVSAQLGVDRAEATTIGFPDMNLCVLFSIDEALVARFNEATRVLATKVGLTWEWRRQRDRMFYTVRQNGA
jgi:hypothetical protein